MVLITIGANGRRLYRGPLTWARLLQSGRPAERPTGGPGSRPRTPTGAQRSPCTSPSPAATVKPGGTVTFEVAGGATHPVVSGDGSNPAGDGRFDDSGCGLAHMTK